MSNEQRNTVWRFAIIFIAIFLGFCAVIGRIIYVQTVERDKWLSVAVHQDPVLQPIPATRGNILDCNGHLLASSMPRYLMLMDTKVDALHQNKGELFYKYVDSLAYDLSRIVGKYSQEEYKKRIIDGYKSGTSRLELNGKTSINYLQRQALDKNVLIKKGKFKSGVFYEERHERIKPYGNLASRTIGSIYGDGGVGNVGLEKRFETELRGEDGITRIEKIGGRKESLTEREAEDGMDIVTTIDANLQDIVEKALIEAASEKHAQWGCAILMETRTGYIRAIANVDRNSDDTYSERLNHAVMRVEPGSTFKTISLIAMMNDGLVSLNDTVSVTAKEWLYLNQKKARHIDSHPKDTLLTVRGALAISSNIAFAKLVTRHYQGSATKFIQSIQRLGVRDSIYCEIPGYERPRINHPHDTVTIGKMAYGYSVEVSPMTLAMFYNAIANNGKMMRPMLVTSVQKNGHDVQTFKPEVVKNSICNQKIIDDIKLALHDVVWNNNIGTASVRRWEGKIVDVKAQSKLVSIAGKTGTAQLLLSSAYSNLRHRITFVGYFPEDNPQYTCICMLEDPDRPHDAGMECGSTVRKIAEKVMAYTGCYVYRNGEKHLEKR